MGRAPPGGDLDDGLVFDASHAIVRATVSEDLPELEADPGTRRKP
ncbi:MAG: hypothetical protein M0T79_15185 [Actinomycetota bacterium]|nr:hypothetical protein [Actinomycetota bacterium]